MSIYQFLRVNIYLSNHVSFLLTSPRRPQKIPSVPNSTINSLKFIGKLIKPNDNEQLNVLQKLFADAKNTIKLSLRSSLMALQHKKY